MPVPSFGYVSRLRPLPSPVDDTGFVAVTLTLDYIILLACGEHISPDRLEERHARGIAHLVRNADHMRL